MRALRRVTALMLAARGARAAGACAAAQGFATLAASDAANPLGVSVVVAPRSTCDMLARSSGSLRCAPGPLTATVAGAPVFYVGRSEDVPLALMGGGPADASCAAPPAPPAPAPFSDWDWAERNAAAGAQFYYSVCSSADASRVFALVGGQSGRGFVHVSSDGGATFAARVTDAARSWGFCAASASGLVAYASTGNAVSEDGCGYGGVMRRSLDGGATWAAVAGLGCQAFRGVACSADCSTVLVNAPAAAFLSTDSGATWATVTPPGGGGGALSQWASGVSADGSRLALASENGGLFLSSTRGASWAAPAIAWGAAPILFRPVMSADGRVVAVGSGFGSSLVLVSTDYGATWGVGLRGGSAQAPVPAGSIFPQLALSSDGRRLAVTATAQAWGGGASVLTTTLDSFAAAFDNSDSGLVWTSRAVPGTSAAAFLALAANAAGTRLVAAAYGGSIFTASCESCAPPSPSPSPLPSPSPSPSPSLAHSYANITTTTPVTWATSISGNAAGDLFIASFPAPAVVRVAAGSGATSQVSSGWASPCGVYADPISGSVYVAEYTGVVSRVAGGGTGAKATVASSFNNPCGLAGDGAGNIFVSDWSNGGSIFRINATTFAVTTVATALTAGASNQVGRLFALPSGDLLAALSASSSVVRVAVSTGAVTTVASGIAQACGALIDASGALWVASNAAASSGGGIRRIADGGAGATTPVGSGWVAMCSLYIDSSGNVFAADGSTGQVARFS